MSIMFARRLLLLPFRASAPFSSSPPKSKSQQKVFLFGADGKIIGVKTKAEAEAIANKANLMLKRKPMPPGQEMKDPPYILYDPKSDFDHVKDTSAPTSVTDKKVKPAGVRDKKKVTIGANINDHDIGTKAKAISKFLKANCEVQIVAYGQVPNERLEEIYKRFEQIFTGLRLVQKILKSGTLKFTILPDPDNFTGITLKDEKQDSDGGGGGEVAFIDDKEVEELVQQKLKEKK